MYYTYDWCIIYVFHPSNADFEIWQSCVEISQTWNSWQRQIVSKEWRLLKQAVPQWTMICVVKTHLFNYPSCFLLEIGKRLSILSTKNVLRAKVYIRDKQRIEGTLASALFISVVHVRGSVCIHSDRTGSHGEAD